MNFRKGDRVYVEIKEGVWKLGFVQEDYPTERSVLINGIDIMNFVSVDLWDDVYYCPEHLVTPMYLQDVL